MRSFLHLCVKALSLHIDEVSCFDKLLKVVSNAEILFLLYSILGTLHDSCVSRGRSIEYIRVNSEKTLIF